MKALISSRVSFPVANITAKTHLVLMLALEVQNVNLLAKFLFSVSSRICLHVFVLMTNVFHPAFARAICNLARQPAMICRHACLAASGAAQPWFETRTALK